MAGGGGNGAKIPPVKKVSGKAKHSKRDQQGRFKK